MKKATREEILMIPGPPRTDTWNPIPHHEILTAVDSACVSIGQEEWSEHFEMSNDGHKLFATYTFGNAPIVPALGYRHATDKSLSLGMCGGNNVTNCSNMMFDGDFVDFRKHTGDFDLQAAFEFAIRTVEMTLRRSEASIVWLENLKGVSVNKITAKAFAYDLVKTGVVPFKYHHRLHECIREELMLSSERDWWSYFNGVTRFLRGHPMWSVMERTGALRGVVNSYL